MDTGAIFASTSPLRTFLASEFSSRAQTELDFGDLSSFDGLSNEERTTGTRIESELASPADMRV